MTLHSHAVAYAEQGLEVFPLKADKTPYTQNGMKDATTDRAAIDAWWSRWPEALIGCRVPEDVVILDLDKRHGGLDTWNALRRRFGGTAHTRVHLSGRGDGGSHRWYRRPDGKLSTKRLDDWARVNEVGHVKGRHSWTAGIDLLHHGHRYTILPPSPHAATGQPYRWLPECGLDEARPAVLPEWLVELLTIDPAEPVAESVSEPPDGDSIADWFSASVSFAELLPRYGWSLVAGDGDGDGSRWRHPKAESPWSATVKNGCLFVYSTSTDFEVTEDGDPRGYTKFRAYAVLEGCDMAEAARRIRLEKDGPQKSHEQLLADIAPDLVREREDKPESETEQAAPMLMSGGIDWDEFWTEELPDHEWVLEPLVPVGRQVAFYAVAKAGKSELILAGVAAAAAGLSVYGQEPCAPVDIVYIDMEMSHEDLRDRLEALGYSAKVDLSGLHYYMGPSFGPLNQAGEGPRLVLATALHHQARLVVIDTTARVVSGDENDAKTYTDLYYHTGLPLKRAGISLLRIDHAGKDVLKGQRGSSAKNDDVDIVWQLKRDGEEGQPKLTRTHSRINWGPAEVRFERTEDESGLLTYRVADGGSRLFASGTMPVVHLLDELGVPDDISRRAAEALLREAGRGTRTEVVSDAVRYRKSRRNHGRNQKNRFQESPGHGMVPDGGVY